jgi:hypothetical protein
MACALMIVPDIVACGLGGRPPIAVNMRFGLVISAT